MNLITHIIGASEAPIKMPMLRKIQAMYDIIQLSKDFCKNYGAEINSVSLERFYKNSGAKINYIYLDRGIKYHQRNSIKIPNQVC